VLTRRVSHMGKGRHTMWGHVSLLLNMHKKECIQNILDEMLLAPACNGARCNKYVTYLSQQA
jgi:hypothetical protein